MGKVTNVVLIKINHHVNSIHKKIKYSCTFCDKVYTSKSYLKRHEKIHQPLSRPNPAQLNPTPNSLADTSSSVSDPQQLPVALSDILLDTEFDDFIKNHISSIYRYKNQRSKSWIFNIDLMTSSLSRLDLMKIFKAHRCVFKINASAGFVLRPKITGKYKYFHSSHRKTGYGESKHMLTVIYKIVFLNANYVFLTVI